jgi:hypothetical protein
MTANKQKRHQPASKADQGGVFAAAFDLNIHALTLNCPRITIMMVEG